jgi:hypothetical protein
MGLILILNSTTMVLLSTTTTTTSFSHTTIDFVRRPQPNSACYRLGPGTRPMETRTRAAAAAGGRGRTVVITHHRDGDGDDDDDDDDDEWDPARNVGRWKRNGNAYHGNTVHVDAVGRQPRRYDPR